MKILVAGGLGYIGSHTTIDLLNHGFEVVIADNEYNSYNTVIPEIENITGKKVKYYKLDLCNNEKVNNLFVLENFDGVIHFAALKAVGESMEKPFLYFNNNNNALLNVLEASHNTNIKAFVFSSSCTVYGDVKTSPVNEDTPMLEAASVYGRTKQMGEQIIRDISATVQFQSTLLRYFNPAGAHESGKVGENSKNPALNLIPVITETAIGKRTSFSVFGTDYDTRDGSCVRDYIHVMDLAHAHTLALKNILHNNQKEKVSIYNLGIGQGISVLEAIHSFQKVTGIKPNYTISPRRAGDVEAIFCDYSHAKNQLGWIPKYNIDDIMKSAWLFEQNKS
jgi:UDP-glucose 4-epimerase